MIESNPHNFEKLREPTIFQESWWLDAAAPGKWLDIQAQFSSGQGVSLKVFKTKWLGISMLSMPPLTRILGPCITGVEGKRESARRMKLRLLAEVIHRLPSHTIFNQVVEYTESAMLAFRLSGFSLGIECTFRIEDCSDTSRVWTGMRDKLRNNIRKTEQQLATEMNAIKVAEFVSFYFSNLAVRGRKPYFSHQTLYRVLNAAVEHNSAEILTATKPDGTLLASIFTVFDKRTMYCFLTTQNQLDKNSGSVALLIWRAINSAAAKGLAFDFDGVVTRELAAFLGQFGGAVYPRVRVSRMPSVLRAVKPLDIQYRPSCFGDDT